MKHLLYFIDKLPIKRMVPMLILLLCLNLVLYIGNIKCLDNMQKDAFGKSFESKLLNLRFAAPKNVYLAAGQDLDDINTCNGSSFHTYMFAYTSDDSMTITICTHTPELNVISTEDYLSRLGYHDMKTCSVEFTGETYIKGFSPANADGMTFEVLCRAVGDTFINIYILYKDGADIEKAYDSFSSFC